MGFNRFSLLLSVRVGLIAACLMLVTWLVFEPGYHATLFLSTVAVIVLVFETLSFVRKTNDELVRFLDALRHGELNQRFEYKQFGAGFEQLGQSFTEILHRFQHKREEQEQTLRYMKALIEQVPVPLVSLHTDGRLTHWNHNARRLFGNHNVERIGDLAQFGKTLPTQLQELQPGEKRLVRFDSEGMSYQLAISATQISIDSRQEKLVSLQDIRSELDVAQLQAWQDLVRVLTHEIMNSITPVASLADTASVLVDDVINEHQLEPAVQSQLDDLQDAVKRVSKRSNSLMQFVSSYRRLTRLPEPNMQNTNVKELLENTINLVTQDWQRKGIEITLNVEPESMIFRLDTSMLEQVLINLLQNAEQALYGVEKPQVTLLAYMNKRNHGVIEITDNGSGIDPDILDRVFVPFFTTKREGSGVGLALTRQVMIAHGGNVHVENVPDGGARFSLLF